MKESFPPIVSPTARILILGSMPSEISLERQEYYGNPLNQFWRIMQALYAIPADAAYPSRVAGLQQKGIALWDVLHSCERIGSLDSAIKNPVPNDFAALFASLPQLQLIAFNGAQAGAWFKRWGPQQPSPLKKLVLPSSSPAATIPFEKKLVAWSELQQI